MAADLTLANDINNMLKPELRSFLLARGITVTDYNVSQLRELAIKASDMKLPVILEKDDSVDSFKKRTTVNLQNRVVNFPFVCDERLEMWTGNLTCIPDVISGDVFAYLLSIAQWTSERTKNYKQERGYQLFKCHHISAVQYHPLQEEHMYIRAKCLRETSQSERLYLVWSLMNNNGSIRSAGCECTTYVFSCLNIVLN